MTEPSLSSDVRSMLHDEIAQRLDDLEYNYGQQVIANSSYRKRLDALEQWIDGVIEVTVTEEHEPLPREELD